MTYLLVGLALSEFRFTILCLRMLEKEHACVEINPYSSKSIRFLTIVLVLLLQLGVFDPFNFLEGVPQEGFDTLRYIELKHGR